MTYTLGIDIGTFESKGVLVDPAGCVAASAAAPHEMIVPRAGWAEHRAEEDWWGDFRTLARRLLEESGIRPSDIDAVGVSAIGPCMLPVDADGQPLTNAVLYGIDNRAAREVEELTEEIGESAILERCGNALTSQSVGPKILWLRRTHPDLFAHSAHILTSTSYLVMKLTGEVVIDHYTGSGFTPLYDIHRLQWNDDLCPDILPLDKLPRLLWTTEIAGRITPDAAAETGLAQGTPVIAGTVDAAAEACSVGVAAPGDMMMMYGSTIFIIALTEGPVLDHRLWYAPWLYPGQHASMAGLATSGTLTHWFRDQFAREVPRSEAFPLLAAEAESSPPGANGLLFLPYFSGERTIAVGTLVSQRPPHRSGRARQGIRLLPSVRRPSELSPHKRRLAHRRGREASCDTLTWRSVQYVLRIPFLPLAPVLPSTDSAEVATPLCSPASTVL